MSICEHDDRDDVADDPEEGHDAVNNSSEPELHRYHDFRGDGTSGVVHDHENVGGLKVLGPQSNVELV